ncbi:MAG: YHYH protein [Bacteroidota bacterium]
MNYMKYGLIALLGAFLVGCGDDEGEDIVDDGSDDGGSFTNNEMVSDIVVNVSQSSAVVTWLVAANESNWTVEYGASGFEQGTGTSGTDADNLGPFGVSKISGLTAGTGYDIYITVDGSSETAFASFTTLGTDESVYYIHLDESTCTVDIENTLGVTSSYTEDVNGTTRTISINDIPSHRVGTFPTSADRRIGNPSSISEQSNTYTMTTEPALAGNSTTAQGWVNGVLFSGVGIEVYTAESFTGFTGQTNRDWNRNALQSVDDLGLDCNNAHVQPTGQYHYHGLPSAYGGDLSVDGSEMVKIGYAADGFPYYYLYFEDDNGTIAVAEASYELKSGDRGGNGITAPSGNHDGEYFQDYEFVDGSGDLDECNGRFGPTPDAPNGEYYYVVTADFPSFPLCFSGTPDGSFRFGPG